MSIKETVENAKFPVHRSGGYQVAAVDALLTEVVAEGEALADALDSERSKRAALEVEVGTLRTDVAREQERVGSLEQRLADATAATAEAASHSPVEVADDSALRAQIEELEAKVREFQSALDEAHAQAKDDEEHIASMEAYADQVEQASTAVKAERDKIRADAEDAIRTLAARLAAAENLAAAAPQAPTVVEPTPAPEPDPVVEVEPEPAQEEAPEPEVIGVQVQPAPLPSPTYRDGEEVDPNEDDRDHQHTPSIATPARQEDTDAPVRPRLMRRS